MPKTMTADIAATLAEPFKPDQIGKLPRISCSACRESRSRNCESHQKRKCPDCDNWITTAHLHLDYVGHAEVTHRLLQADAEWTWEPMAFDSDGLPKLDPMGGLWIRLTIAGVTRNGYGHADGKKGADAVKETIGDALRNAAMRFGVALDLWGAKLDSHDAETPAPGVAEPVSKPAVTMLNAAQRSTIFGLWGDLGFKGDEHREVRLEITSKILGGIEIESTSDLTAAEGDILIRALRDRRAALERKAKQEAQQ